MKPYHNPSFSSLILASNLFTTLFASETTLKGVEGCKPPSTWELEWFRCPDATHSTRPSPTPSAPRRKILEAGDINCQYWAEWHVDALGCEAVNELLPPIDTSFELNPILESDIENVRPFTEYCFKGC